MLLVGDSEADMRTAVNAGIPGIGVLWGFRDEKELRENGAKYIIDSPDEIIKIIGEIGERE